MEIKRKGQVEFGNGITYLLTYDFNNNKEGVTETVKCINGRLSEEGKVELQKLVKEIIPVKDKESKRAKTRYVLVGVPKEKLYYTEVKKKNLDFYHKAMGYKDLEYQELKLAESVGNVLKKMNLIPAETKYSGVAEASWEDLEKLEDMEDPSLE